MGAVNYSTSDYITMGLKPYDVDDITHDSDFMDFIRDEWGVDITDQEAVYNAACDEISAYYESDYENIEFELNKHNFHYYHIAIKPGYYAGFTLDIENNYGLAYDSWEDKREAQKEITEIKQFLIACAGMGLVKCSPGWCTGYSDYNGTIKAIGVAIKEMREESRAIPTWAQYCRREHK